MRLCLSLALILSMAGCSTTASASGHAQWDREDGASPPTVASQPAGDATEADAPKAHPGWRKAKQAAVVTAHVALFPLMVVMSVPTYLMIMSTDATM